MADAEDVLVETFTICWRRADNLPEDPLPWLLAVARKALANHWRSSLRRTALLDRIHAGDRPEIRAEGGDAADTMTVECIRNALGRLNDTDREAILLVAWDGLTNEQAARVLGMRRAAFSMRLSRARGRLRQYLTATSEESG